MKSRFIQDLCGNKYYITEAVTNDGYKYTEVYEVINVDGQEMKTYLCGLDTVFQADDNDILDEIAAYIEGENN